MSIAKKTIANLEMVDSSFELITPEDAKRLLARTNFRNRPISKKHVNYLADLILAGYWKTNGDTIKLDKSGNVLDGQHRLHAIIKSQKTVMTCVVRNLDQSVFDAIDNYRRTRTDGNVLAIAGHKHTTPLASAVKTVAAFDQIGQYAFPVGRAASRERYAVKASTVLSLIDKYDKIHESVKFVHSLNNVSVFNPTSFVASVHYIFGRHDSLRRDWFFDSLRRNHFGSLTCPARALFMAYQSKHLQIKMQASHRYRAALWFKTFSAYCDGRQISQLRFHDSEDFPTLS